MGTVIKASQSNNAFAKTGAADFEFEDFNQQPCIETIEFLEGKVESSEAELELQRAKTAAQIIVDTARLEIQKIYEDSAEEGYRAGLEQAKQEAALQREALSNETGKLIQRLEEDIEQTAQDRLEVLNSVEPAVLKLVVESVEKLVRHEIKTDQRVVIRNIRACLRRIKDVNEVTVRVNPAEIAYVKEQREELISCSECVHGVAIVDDRRVGLGGCVIESSSGDFDARIETQLDKIRNTIEEIASNANCSAGS